MAKISHGKKPREILFIDQLLIYSGLFPVACSGFDVAGLLKYGDHQGRIGRAEIGICKPQRRATAFILPLEILSAGTVVVLNGRCAEGFGEAFACGFKMLFCRAARKLWNVTENSLPFSSNCASNLPEQSADCTMPSDK